MLEWGLGIAGGVITSILITVINENRKLRAEKKQRELENQNAEDELLLGVARVILMNSLEKALERGSTTTNEYEILNKLFTAYTKRGGNGAIKHLFERFNTLKVY